jgi:hypothetical protein
VDPVSTLPQWYQDANGLQLQPCLTPGTCATILPNPAAPPSFPNNWPAETFYWNATAKMPTGGTGNATLTLATEAAFLNGVVAGQGTAISRIRITITGGLVPGATYKVTEPYGVETLTADALGAARFTEDAGCGVPSCAFTTPIGGRVGPWLRWDPAVAPAPPAGYIGNFAVPHAVTGSPLGTNFFRIDGPNVGGPGVNAVQTNLFQLQGQTVGPGGVPPTLGVVASIPPPVAQLIPGPLDPVSTLPLWYEDRNGLRLQGCMTPGICATILPNPAAPPSFPNNWPAEMFYWDATANMTTGGGKGKTTLILATEAAFPNGVVAGQGTAISRIRVVISTSGLVPGATYKVTEPYGVDTLTADARGNAKFTQDVGCSLPPCAFTAPIGGRVGPWLIWDPAVAPAPPAGYIGNFAVPHAVIGSPFGTNVFRIDGPNAGGPGVKTVQTNLFQLQGQLAVP